jgi:hypothetical protein
MIWDLEQRDSASHARELLLATSQGQSTVLTLASALKAFVGQVLPADFREAVHQVLELVAGVFVEATAGRWGKAWELYERAERVAVDLDTRLVRVQQRRAARKASREAGLAKARQREDRARAIFEAADVAEFREEQRGNVSHLDMATVHHIQRKMLSHPMEFASKDLKLNARTLRHYVADYLTKAGA